MPYTEKNTLFLNPSDMGFQHGVYSVRTVDPLRLKQEKLKKDLKGEEKKIIYQKIQEIAAEKIVKDWLILWFPPKESAYPTLSEAKVKNLVPNGGVLMDLDYPEVATFAVYKYTVDNSYSATRIR